jgi:hypothetical protein
MAFWLVLKLGISYRVMIPWRILVSFRGFFEDYNFCMVKYLSFHNSSFALNVNGKATVWHTPCIALELALLETCNKCTVWLDWYHNRDSIIVPHILHYGTAPSTAKYEPEHTQWSSTFTFFTRDMNLNTLEGLVHSPFSLSSEAPLVVVYNPLAMCFSRNSFM